MQHLNGFFVDSMPSLMVHAHLIKHCDLGQDDDSCFAQQTAQA